MCPCVGSRTNHADQPDTTLADAEAKAATAKETLAATVKEYEDAEKRVLAEFHDSPLAKRLEADMNMKLSALETARSSGTTQQKLDASSAYTKARATYLKAEAGAKTESEELRKLFKLREAQVNEAAAANSEVQALRSKIAARKAYEAEHPWLTEATAKLDAIDAGLAAPQGAAGSYERYQATTGKFIEALQILDELGAKEIPDDDYAAVLTRVQALQQTWEKGLSQREAIYPSADSVRPALKHYQTGFEWDKLAKKRTESAKQSLQTNQADSALADLDSSNKLLRSSADELLAGRRTTEDARRLLLTEENTKPALPNSEGKD